jgi:hypothetical protein
MSRLSDMFALYLRVQNIDLRTLEVETGMNKATLSRFQNGRSITHENFIKLLIWLESSPQTKEKGNRIV